MAVHSLENGELKLLINDMGAELVSMCDVTTNSSYLWNGDAAYWGRVSPVLFPFVGGLKNRKYTYKGVEYPMGQHGFARDMEFTMTERTDDSVRFCLESDPETKESYPFDFALWITYRLQGRAVDVIWEVENRGDDRMYFSIGGHPAFMCPFDGRGVQAEYSLKFDTDRDYTITKISKNGLALPETVILKGSGGVVPITESMFDEDALVIEQDQAHQVSLMDPDGRTYVTVSFDAPLFGIWSPSKKNAPFICIEPWYGRCDREDYTGSLDEREWEQELEAGEIFKRTYTITV